MDEDGLEARRVLLQATRRGLDLRPQSQLVEGLPVMRESPFARAEEEGDERQRTGDRAAAQVGRELHGRNSSVVR